MVAHAHGVARAVAGREELLLILNRLADIHEATQPAPWHVGDAPTAYIDKLLRAIVGIENPIDRLEGKLKVSQDEALPDRLGTVQGLRQRSGAAACAMADLVWKAIEAEANGRA